MQLPINDFVQPMRFTVSDTVVIWQKLNLMHPEILFFGVLVVVVVV